MKIGILETGEVHPDLKARHGDYPAMFEALLGAADPGARVRHRAGGRGRDAGARRGEADAWLVTGSRHGVYDGLPWIEPLKAFLRDCVAARVPVVGHLLRPPDPRRGAGRAGGEVGQRLGARGAGLRDDRPARLDGRAAPTASRCGRCTRTRWSRCRRARRCSPARRIARSPRWPTATPRRRTRCSLQPHPEFGPEFMDELLALRAGTVFPVEAADAARALAGAPGARARPGRG